MYGKNLCIECKHCKIMKQFFSAMTYECVSPRNIDIVTGENYSDDCYDHRSDPFVEDGKYCGKEGKWFESKHSRSGPLM